MANPPFMDITKITDVLLRQDAVSTYQVKADISSVLTDAEPNYDYLGSSSGGAIPYDLPNPVADLPVATVAEVLRYTTYVAYVGRGAMFDHTLPGYLSVANRAGLQAGNADFTVTGFFRTTDATSTRTIASKWGATLANQEWVIEHLGTGNLQARYTGSADVSPTVIGDVAVTTNTFHRVVFWQDTVANTINFQIDNNAPISAARPTGGLRAGTTSFQLAAANGGVTYSGVLDSWAVFNRVLTVAERTWLWNSGSGRCFAALGEAGTDGVALPTSLGPWWDLEETTGSRTDANGTDALAVVDDVFYSTGVTGFLARSASIGGVDLVVVRADEFTVGDVMSLHNGVADDYSRVTGISGKTLRLGSPLRHTFSPETAAVIRTYSVVDATAETTTNTTTGVVTISGTENQGGRYYIGHTRAVVGAHTIRIIETDQTVGNTLPATGTEVATAATAVERTFIGSANTASAFSVSAAIPVIPGKDLRRVWFVPVLTAGSVRSRILGSAFVDVVTPPTPPTVSIASFTNNQIVYKVVRKGHGDRVSVYRKEHGHDDIEYVADVEDVDYDGLVVGPTVPANKIYNIRAISFKEISISNVEEKHFVRQEQPSPASTTTDSWTLS